MDFVLSSTAAQTGSWDPQPTGCLGAAWHGAKVTGLGWAHQIALLYTQTAWTDSEDDNVDSLLPGTVSAPPLPALVGSPAHTGGSLRGLSVATGAN